MFNNYIKAGAGMLELIKHPKIVHVPKDKLTVRRVKDIVKQW